jgi:hypothetical protein
LQRKGYEVLFGLSIVIQKNWRITKSWLLWSDNDNLIKKRKILFLNYLWRREEQNSFKNSIVPKQTYTQLQAMDNQHHLSSRSLNSCVEWKKWTSLAVVAECSGWEYAWHVQPSSEYKFTISNYYSNKRQTSQEHLVKQALT